MEFSAARHNALSESVFDKDFSFLLLLPRVKLNYLHSGLFTPDLQNLSPYICWFFSRETLFRQPSSAAVNNRIYRPKPAKLSVLVSNLKGQSRQKQRQPASTSSAFPWIAEMQQQNQFGETEEEEEKGEEAATTTLRGGLRRQGEEVTTTLKVKSQRKKESEEDRPPVSSGGAGSSNSFFKETKFVPAPATAATAGVKKDEEGFIQTSSKKVEKIPLSQFLEEIHQGLNENEFRLTTAKDAGSSTTTASTTTATTTTTTTTSTTTTTIPSTMPTFITRRTTTPRNSWMREPSIPHLSDFLFSNAVTSSAKRAFSSKLDSLINNNSRLLIVLQEQLKLQRESLQIMKEMKKALAVATEDNKAAGNNNSDSQLS